MKTTKKHSNNKGKKKTKFSWKMFISFIVFEFIFTGITGPFMLYYGPFQNARNTMVGAAMTTMTHQWIATTFLSQDRINEILSKNKVQDIRQDNSDGDEIKIKNIHDNTIERYNIDGEGSTYKGYVLIIHNPKRVKVGYSSKLPKVGETTSKIARNYRAIAAVNAGGFTDESANGQQWAGNGGQPSGIIMSKGTSIYNDYKNDFIKDDIVAMTKEGKLLVGKHTVSELKEKNVTDAVSFGPALIVNGKKTIKSGDGNWGTAPRTAIGQRRDGSIILLVLDGKHIKRLAATLRDVQDVLYEYGAYNASNLDGGSSTTMYYEGKVINEPSNALGERSIPSVIYVEP
ncbi:phosphodiester glycosidase family protein [Clostridium botulinum]|uniref:Exopolysaccharide biosynthesis protein n=1 Tax=Clostridium botulinum C/D str. DC5 TaxID=1443128 RepID=A0A0A0IHX8_CLOBO|nr:phosphodiester glycosidase family protein [Clostridium botulinum]KGM99841.1 exopolysaccharide biosynthesis protein [Clostridium botulinum C/D str. DC5]KOC56705.1 exopolysaccharide biosynthesis protein [Clostridium botulinum]KOC58141.1 exopolysaccharide biosynthesis protein [Clostridium botulinum]MCD3234033.1 exopolysaccharide biosynthesis protein [Clostridium botulinum D/C]MCD3239870.1 exopolysaccharide biosynthesis protein [Clostridium botulinum D/C]